MSPRPPPEPLAVADVEAAVAMVLGDAQPEGRQRRHEMAQRLGRDAPLSLAEGRLAYGELDVVSVARILEAAEVQPGDRFLDIGSGEGLPVFAAALLYPQALQICRGVEIVGALATRAEAHARRIEALTERGSLRAAPIELIHGDVDEAADGRDSCVARALADTTLALCFATTWSQAPRRALPELSTTLHAAMPAGARVVVVDARLVEADGWRWEGDLRITPPDTAPHSTARLYGRLG